MIPSDRMLKLMEVMEITGLSATSVYRRIKDSRFPEAKSMGPRASRWSECEVLKWLSERPVRGGRGTKETAPGGTPTP